MGILNDINSSLYNILKTREETPEFPTNSNDVELFKDVFGYAKEMVTPEDALEIPIVNACISRISDIIACTKLYMYKRSDEGVEKISDDIRVKLLNSDIDSGSINSFEFKKLIVRDYFLRGSSYFYIKKKKNEIEDIVYMKDVNVSYNDDPFNKMYEINVRDRKLKPHEFLKITRNTENGVTGKSIVKETEIQFLLILRTMEHLLNDAKRGFLSKGLFKLETNTKKVKEVEEAIKRVLSDNSNGYMVINQGLNFESMERKSDAEKDAKAHTMEINRIAAMFGVPVSIINGNGTDVDKFNFINFTILPLLTTIESSLNRDLLLENEKGTYYFAFDNRELLKGNIYERFKAYEIGIRNNIMTMDEVRDAENMERFHFDFYKFNIADAMYYCNKEKDVNMLINVNTNTVMDINKVLSGEDGVSNLEEMNENKNLLEDKTSPKQDDKRQEDVRKEV